MQADPAETAKPPPFPRLLRVWLFIVASLSAAFVYALRIHFGNTESYFLLWQDLPMLFACLGLVGALAVLPLPGLGPLDRSLGAAPRAWACGLAVLTLVIGAVGTPLVFGGYTFSLDEFLANFDAQIFAHGRLMAPIPPEWRPFARALQPMFLIEAPDQSLWASGYLPINAAVRALGLRLGAEALINPAWSALSVAMVYAVARRLWPERPTAALAAAALLATSAQLLVMSMTAYAMPAHLALNLVWLERFLRGGKQGHGAAIITGFFACGLHQIIFHPLFAAPFVLQLWLDRRWTLAAVYTAAYAAIGIFWVEYWPLDLHLSGVPDTAAGAFGAGRLAAEIMGLLRQLKIESVGEIAEGMVRFVTWQNPLAVPLALLGGRTAFRTKGPMRALAFGVVLTLATMLVLEPTPVHGWGYRYLHGLLGSVCLLAVWNWTRLADSLPPRARQSARAGFALACAASLLLFAPVRAWQAWRYVRPYANASATIRAAPAQIVVIDRDYAHWFDIGTLTRNDPFLRTSPKVMLLGAMDDAAVRRACAGYSILVFDGRKAQALGMDLLTASTFLEGSRQRALMARLGCGRRIE